LKTLAAGVVARKIDATVRDFFKTKGYHKEFLHGLGHSLGLEIHEPPRLNRLTKVHVKPSMVLTVEPGLYLNDFGGVRIEDTVLVKERGLELLTKSPKHLLEV